MELGEGVPGGPEAGPPDEELLEAGGFVGAEPVGPAEEKRTGLGNTSGSNTEVLPSGRRWTSRRTASRPVANQRTTWNRSRTWRAWGSQASTAFCRGGIRRLLLLLTLRRQRTGAGNA